MKIGIRNVLALLVDQVVTNNNVLANTLLTVPVGAGETIKGKLWLPFSVGATGGVQIQLTCSVAPTSYKVGALIVNTVTPAVIPGYTEAQAPIANALAVAGDHFIECDFVIVAAAATVVTLQIAQNSADALSLTLKQGATLETVLI